MRSGGWTGTRGRAVLASAVVAAVAAGCGDLFGPEASEPYLFVAGESNTFLGYDGEQWSFLRGPDAHDFTSIWATAPDDVYAATVYDGILHYDGSVWTEWEPPPDGPDRVWLEDVWGTSSSDIFAAGERSTLFHFDGSAWSYVDIDGPGAESRGDISFYGVWGTGPSDVFLVGSVWGNYPDLPVQDSPAIWHYDGTTWSAMPLPSDVPDHQDVLLDVWGSGADDVWAVGTGGLILHYDGAEWRVVPRPSGVLSWLTSVHGRSSTDFYVSTSDGELLYWSGTLSSGRFLKTEQLADGLSAVRVAADGEVWAVGGRTLLRGGPDAWREVDTGATADLSAIWVP